MSHPESATGLLLLVSALVVPLVGYLLAAAEIRSDWPARRGACWLAGLAVLGAGLAFPGHTFTAHIVTHLLVGMVAPLLLVLADPMSLALRALPVERARTLVRLLRSPPIRTLGSPAAAAVLNVGGLWLLYATPYYDHPLVHVHLLVAGYLFTAAILGAHPAPAGFRTRAAVLVVALAAHGILAKHLYAQASTADVERGAMLMYYGGDAVDAALIVLLCRDWFRRARPATAPPDARRAGHGSHRRASGHPPGPR